MMDLQLSNDRRMKVEEFDSGKMLAHASKQAKDRGYENFPIIDVDSHHYELESFDEILEYMPDPVLKQLALMRQLRQLQGRRFHAGIGVGYQDIGGRVIRYPMRRIEKPAPTGIARCRRRGNGWTRSASTRLLFPSPMLLLGLHPQVEAEVALARAYNRWLSSVCCAGGNPQPVDDVSPVQRSRSQLPDGQGIRRQEGRVGFMVASMRYKPVYHNAYMKIYGALEEMGLPLAFHAGYNWGEPSIAKMNKFISVHAIVFV